MQSDWQYTIKTRTEMKTRIFITLFFAGLIYSSYAQDNSHVDFRSKIRENKGVKKITRKTSAKWKVISFFDKEGHVLQETHAYKKEMRSDYRFHYTVTDTLIETRRVNRIFDDYIDSLRINRYYYNASNQCYKFNVYFSTIDQIDHLSDFNSIDDFVYILYMKMECLSAIHKAQQKTFSSTTKKNKKKADWKLMVLIPRFTPMYIINMGN